MNGCDEPRLQGFRHHARAAPVPVRPGTGLLAALALPHVAASCRHLRVHELEPSAVMTETAERLLFTAQVLKQGSLQLQLPRPGQARMPRCRFLRSTCGVQDLSATMLLNFASAKNPGLSICQKDCLLEISEA